jgi:hypothetical protein
MRAISCWAVTPFNSDAPVGHQHASRSSSGRTAEIHSIGSKPLNSLLKTALDAHGGLNAWNRFEALDAHVSIGGALWDLKQLPGVFNSAHVELKLRSEHVTMHLLDAGEKIVFTPTRISLETEGGKTLATRDDPRSAFAGQTAESKWDKLHAGYFASYALWGYLTTPFLYTDPGFATREIDPWAENGERWRVLEVTFPDAYAAHTRTQYVYFGEDGLVRRHLYTVDVLGGAPGTNYAAGYQSVSGLMVATRRTILAYNEARQKIDQPILVSIDIDDIRFAKG